MSDNRNLKFVRDERDAAGHTIEVYVDIHGRYHRFLSLPAPEFYRKQTETIREKTKYYEEMANISQARSKLKLALAEEEDIDRLVVSRALPAPRQRALPPRILDDVDYRREDDDDERY